VQLCACLSPAWTRSLSGEKSRDSELPPLSFLLPPLAPGESVKRIALIAQECKTAEGSTKLKVARDILSPSASFIYPSVNLFAHLPGREACKREREREGGGIKQMAPSFGASACKSLPWERHVSIIHAAAKSFSNCRAESACVPPAE